MAFRHIHKSNIKEHRYNIEQTWCGQEANSEHFHSAKPKIIVWKLLASPKTTQELTTRQTITTWFKISVLATVLLLLYTTIFFFTTIHIFSCSLTNNISKTCWKRTTKVPLKIKAELWPCSAAFSFVSSIRCSSLWRASCSCFSSFSASYFIPGKSGASRKNVLFVCRSLNTVREG